ncbi:MULTISPECIES: flagellar hook-associated protein FlgL [Bacillaceae]|uniref:flagellar hook-associated protein FlgL n=1 Tax=Bacillaceae TaxID=186817 RepID=UPI001E3DE99A|nr:MULTISPECIES: flagellar hook-associated protein FlgL [Bacillaceae]MCE4049426.1 flagellar hook-associated protein FlgL [Bacillus sp. Au-Bac7]MDL0437609.1 flagellar hook-associated protein FlgL [Niallia sp. SS-2023]UPO87213.1 flagellar hook-associated protein FlgL [Niallia sp. Man26]
MRVTQSMLSANSLRNISNSYNKMNQLSNQVATGKKITKPSDDPVVAMKGMYYRSSLSEVEQYKRNLSELYLWMDNSEASMNQASSGLDRVRELLVQGKTDTNGVDERGAIAEEINQIKEDLVNVANTKVNGKYLFHGTDISNPPVTAGNPPQVAANIADGSIDSYTVEVSSGVSMKANVNPATFNQEMFDVVQEIQDKMENNDTTGLDELLTRLDSVMNSLSSEKSELGARYNRLEMVESRIDAQEVLANKVLSDNEDVDMEVAITNLSVQESVHNASLSVGARIIQTSLIDFLR